MQLKPPPPAPVPGGPVLRIAVGVPVTWRSASVAPTSGKGFSYHGGSPYPGFAIAVALAPLRAAGVTGWLEPIELAFEGSRGYASVAVAGAAGPSLAVRELRLGVDAVYPVRLGASTELAGRIGYGWHRFTIEQNSIMPDSLRHGLRIGADARQVLFRAVSVEASARIFPAMGPGPAEREMFGADGSGWGYQLGAALEGPIHARLGWRAAYDLLHFSDDFSGPGTAGTGGSGAATYHNLTAAATFRW